MHWCFPSLTGPLELDLQRVVICHVSVELNLVPPEEQSVLLIHEPSLQPPEGLFWDHVSAMLFIVNVHSGWMYSWLEVYSFNRINSAIENAWEYTPQHVQISGAAYWIKEARCRKEYLHTIPYSTINKISSWKLQWCLTLGYTEKSRDCKDKLLESWEGSTSLLIFWLHGEREKMCNKQAKIH